MTNTQYALIASILPRLSDDELEELRQEAQFLLVRRQSPAVLTMPDPRSSRSGENGEARSPGGAV